MSKFVKHESNMSFIHTCKYIYSPENGKQFVYKKTRPSFKGFF